MYTHIYGQVGWSTLSVNQIAGNMLGGDQGEIVALGVEFGTQNGTQGEVGASLIFFYFLGRLI